MPDPIPINAMMLVQVLVMTIKSMAHQLCIYAGCTLEEMHRHLSIRDARSTSAGSNGDSLSNCNNSLSKRSI